MADIPDGTVAVDGLSCSCSIRVHEDGPVAIHFCPLHAAAPKMLAALEKVEFAGDCLWITCPWCGADEPHHAPDCSRQAAIAAAKGE